MSERLASTFRRGTFTNDAIRIASALAKAGIVYCLEYPFLRVGEFRNGHPLQYVVDIMLLDERYEPVAIEVEGKGSASKDNDRRDEYLSTLGVRVLHVDNKVKGTDVIARLNGSFRKP